MRATQPDLVLLDLRLGDGDGLDLLPELHNFFPKLPVLVLSQNDEELYAERALRAGARGYIMKEEATEEVLTAITVVLGGQTYVTRRMSARMVAEFLDPKARPKAFGVEALTNRELRVFERLGAGRSSKEIAAELGLSIKTIQTHRENLKRKLHLSGSPALVRHATAWLEQQRKAGTANVEPPQRW